LPLKNKRKNQPVSKGKRRGWLIAYFPPEKIKFILFEERDFTIWCVERKGEGKTRITYAQGRRKKNEEVRGLWGSQKGTRYRGERGGGGGGGGG